MVKYFINGNEEVAFGDIIYHYTKEKNGCISVTKQESVTVTPENIDILIKKGWITTKEEQPALNSAFIKAKCFISDNIDRVTDDNSFIALLEQVEYIVSKELNELKKENRRYSNRSRKQKRKDS